MTIIFDAMKHYLTKEEFKKFLLDDHSASCGSFSLLCEDTAGDTTRIELLEISFFGRNFLYTHWAFQGVGIIQEAPYGGYDADIDVFWADITEGFEWKPFINVDVSGKNLF